MGSSSQSTSNPAQQTIADEGLGTVGAGSPINTGTTQYAAGGNLTLDLTPGVVDSALSVVNSAINKALESVGKSTQTVTETLSSVVDSSQEGQQASLTQNNAMLEKVLQNEMKLAESVQSAGQTETNKTILTVIGIVVGAVSIITGIFLWRKRT